MFSAAFETGTLGMLVRLSLPLLTEEDINCHSFVLYHVIDRVP